MSKWAAFWSRPMPTDELRSRVVFVGTMTVLAFGCVLAGARDLGYPMVVAAVTMSGFTAYRLYMSARAEKKNSDQ